MTELNVSKNQLDWKIPFRVSVIGSMDQGKSTLLTNLICYLENIVEKNDFKVTVVLINNLTETAKTLVEICKKKNYEFVFYQKIPDLKLLQNNPKDTHKIICFEDFSYRIHCLERDKIEKLSSFLLASRHLNISIVYILHQIKLSQKFNFEKNFLENSSVFCIFLPKTNKKSIYSFLRNVLTKNTVSKLDDIFSLSQRIMDYPFLVINTERYLKSDISKIRIDPFGINLILHDFNED